ncbi:SapC family protein [Alteromonadaceae bacterium M269]|nr:SapC family protein [Alteromonadaceae bacterium M269]
MSQFVVLSSEKHSQLKLKKNAIMAYAATQQALPIEAVEVTKAVTNFPVFFTKNPHDEMTLSAIAGLNPGVSLFMHEAKWDAAYLPNCLRTYPFYLVRSPEDEKKYTVGIQEENPSFSTDEGDALFDEQGNASAHLERVSNALNNELVNIQATIQMVEALTRLELFKPIELIVQYHDNTAKKINGLYTIDEEKLSQLPEAEVADLHMQGFLVVFHALLISVYQVNNLVRRHNESDAKDKIVNIQIELPKEGS